MIARPSSIAATIERYAERSTAPLSASWADNGTPRVAFAATICATARLRAWVSNLSTLNNSSRMGVSLSQGVAFFEIPDHRRGAKVGAVVDPASVKLGLHKVGLERLRSSDRAGTKQAPIF